MLEKLQRAKRNYMFQGEVKNMRKEYDFSKGIKNPYAKKLKTKISMNVDDEVINYFKKQSMDLDIPYQTLMNLFLRDCANNKKKLNLQWK